MGVGRDGLMAKAEYKHALWTSKRQQGVRMTDRTSSLAQRTHQSKLKGPPYQRQSHEKIDLSRLGERGLFMVCEEGSHVTRPRSRKSPKRGGIQPIPPLLGLVERARDLETRWVYREPGKARFMSRQMGR